MRFFELFPPPKYLNLADAGVSIDERAVRIVSLAPLRYEEIALPEGVVVGGEVVNKTLFAESLGKLKSSGLEYVNLSIPEDKAYIFTTKVQSATYRDLADAVAFTVEENAPVKLANSTYAFEYLGEPRENGPEIDVSLSVLPTDLARSWIDAFKHIGISVASIDLRSEAVARSLVRKGDERTHLIIDLRETITGLYLVENEMVKFSSSIKANLTEKNPDAVAALKGEIRKVFLFSKDKKIEHITLSGAGATDEAFTAMVLAEAETPYSAGNVWVNTTDFKKKLPDMTFEESLKYAGAIGAALPPSKRAYV